MKEGFWKRFLKIELPFVFGLIGGLIMSDYEDAIVLPLIIGFIGYLVSAFFVGLVERKL